VKAQSLPEIPLATSGEFTDTDYARGMARLVQAVQELSLTRSLPEVQRIVRTAARELTGCDGASFVLRDDDKCYYADENAIAPLWKGSRFPLEACVSGWAMLNRDSAVIPDIYRDVRVPHEAYRPTFVKSLVMVPIRKLDPIGAIGNYWANERTARRPMSRRSCRVNWTGRCGCPRATCRPRNSPGTASTTGGSTTIT
jgi:hypothetical protein